jgi:ABC-type sugar transport system permease subunit
MTNGFKLFDQNLALTGGDPGHASEMLALNIYNTFYARSGTSSGRATARRRPRCSAYWSYSFP